MTGPDLVVASNRGPSNSQSASGLSSGLSRALRDQTATWVCVVPTPVDQQINSGTLANSRVRLHNVAVEADEFEAYYNRMSNSVLYPLHVGLLDDVCTAPSMLSAWEAYKLVNRHVAASCTSLAGAAGHVLVQDYHLSIAPAMIRAARPDVSVAHFTHCTWAEPADFGMLPRSLAHELISGMLGADVVGFYALRWAKNFLRSCALAGFRVSLDDGSVCAPDGRCVPVRAYPAGVDPIELRYEAASPAAMRHRRMLEELAAGRQLVVRVERMDPVKNLLRGLDAFAAFLHDNPSMHDRITHFVLACTTRPGIAGYDRYRAEVVARVRAINTEFGTSTWRPVFLAERPDYFLGLAALALADIVVINSLRDGVPIVSREAAAVNERDAVLILSRDAGAVEDLGCYALVVDPRSTPELTAAIGRALGMSSAERHRRAEAMRGVATSIAPREWLVAQTRDLTGVR